MAERAARETHDRHDAAGLGTIRVLLVEEEPLVRKGLRCFLQEQWGPVVETLESPAAERSTPGAEDLHPLLIVLGATHEAGTAAGVRSLLEQAPRARVVVLADEDDPDDAREAFAAGAFAYVLRDRALDELRIALDDVLAGAHYLDPAVGASLVSEPSESARDLTAREQLVLELVADGLTNREIATRLGLSARTIEGARARAQCKLGLRTRSAVVEHVRHAHARPIAPDATRTA